MRVLDINSVQARELPPCSAHTLPEPPAPGHFYWLSVTRAELHEGLPPLQTWLQALTGVRLVDLHVSDLLNEHLPSHYDATSAYDVLVLRRLASAPPGEATPVTAAPALRSGPPVLRHIDTRPVGFVVFERLLLTVHPEDGSVRDAVAERLMTADAQPLDVRAVSSRLPAGPADLMLRVANQIVDGYLALRRELTRQLDHWQAELIDPKTRFTNWGALMQARQGLHYLDEICEDQQTAVQDWIDTLEALPVPDEAGARRDHELLLVRSRDVLEHIERVVRHVRRLEQNAELAVQLHFNVQSHRTNDIMRVLTVLTAVFLPLNLIAGIFGMNFEFIPLVHAADGFWVALVAMVLIAAALVVVFWRKRYLARTTH
ncbi:magnesium transporter CorA family protein [Pseudacidovorax intermedius]|uniref:magnesium transporter CorA family protein n=1 Tax=Pseudacidovorax intermedius TaxID=433924 RepID=UPI0003465414|nr:magnesium transporter CorA family protein [Pseudacidovorax intermedius]